MKRAIRAAAAAFLVIVLTACQGPYLMETMQQQMDSMKARAAKAITAFSFASHAAKATIDESAKTIAATVPYGTDVTALVAIFTTTGSSVKVSSTVQVSGITANNFTSPVVYTVTAADGSTVNYMVTVTVGGGSGYLTESDLVGRWTVSFQWSGRTPAVFTMVINSDHTYQVPAAPGVGASSGTLSLSINGNSITMVESGPSSERRTWTGTAASSTRFTGTLHTYSGDNTGTFDACKQGGGSSAKAITAFSFVSPAVTGTIDEHVRTIAVAVPYGTNVTALVAIFTTTGKSVKVSSTVQVSGITANNFTSPAIYTVTSADGSSASYAVTVTPERVPSRSNLKAEYLFNGNANDTSGKGLHGIVHGATLTSDRFGNPNSAYSFNGIDNYIEIPLAVDPNADSFSFHTFYMMDDVEKDATAFHLGNNGGEIVYYHDVGSPGIGFGVKASDGVWHSTDQRVLERGRWYSIAGVYVKGSKLRLYVDGMLADEKDLPDLPVWVYQPLKSTIGCTNYSYAGGCQHFWPGRVDDFRFYSCALTDAEIGHLYHEGGWTSD